MDLYQCSFLATANGHGEFHVQTAFDYKGNQQDLGFMGLMNGYKRALWNFKKEELCTSCRRTSKFRALCDEDCCGTLLRAI